MLCKYFINQINKDMSGQSLDFKCSTQLSDTKFPLVERIIFVECNLFERNDPGVLTLRVVLELRVRVRERDQTDITQFSGQSLLFVGDTIARIKIFRYNQYMVKHISEYYLIRSANEENSLSWLKKNPCSVFLTS